MIDAYLGAIFAPPIGGCRNADPNLWFAFFLSIVCLVRMHQAAPKSTPHLANRDRLVAVIEPVVRAHGAELVDLELKNENGWVLRVYVEKLGAAEKRMSTKEAAVDLELCSQIARDLSPALDVADPIPTRYNLEVGSPGLERPLKSDADFVRFAGEKAKLKLDKGVSGQKVLVGKLGAVDGDRNLTVEDGGRSYEVPLDDVVAARLVFEFGPASKPGPHAGKKKKRKS